MHANLEKVLRVLKYRGLFETTTENELAKLSGLSRKTINQSKADIECYLQTAPYPSIADCRSVDNKTLQNYVDMAILQTKENENQIVNVMGAIAGFILRHETDLINTVHQPAKIIRTGQALIRLYAQISARKDDTKGTPIHSQNKEARYLLNELNKAGFVDRLFQRSQGYKTGFYSKRWRPSELTQSIIQQTIAHTIPLIKRETTSEVTLSPLHIPSLICSRETVTSSLDTNTLSYSPLSPEHCTTLVRVDTLQSLSIPSILHLLSQSKPSGFNGYLCVSLQHLSATDPNLGRVYNVFTRLKSSERKALGYRNYDISSGLQIISFGLLYRYASDRYQEADDLIATYEMIFKYAWDVNYKRRLREQIAQELNISMDEVKQLLTAYANGSTKNIEGSEVLKQFQQESDLLRREVVSVIAQHEPQVLEAALAQTRHHFPDEVDWLDSSEDDEVAREKASVFFFIWTHYEKQIRDAMLSVVNDGIPLHDAIYSKQDVPYSVFEQAIEVKTGFQVKVSG